MTVGKIYTQNELETIKGNYVLGTLAVGENYYPRVGEDQEVVTPTKGDGILFFVKSLSPDPIPIKEEDGPIDKNFYIGFDDTVQSLFTSPDYRQLSTNERIEYIKKKLGGKLFLFNPILKIDDKNKRIHKNLKLFSIEEGEYREGDEFYPIPVVKMGNQEFEHALMEGKEIDFIDYNHSMDSPKYVQCGQYLYSNFGEWKNHRRTKSTRTLLSVKGVMRILINKDDHMEYVAAGLDYLNFFPVEYLEQVVDTKFKDQGVSFESWDINEDEITITNNDEVKDQSKEAENTSNLLEYTFLEAFEQYVLKKKLYYEKEDLINFHTSIKTNALNILAGQSGTGKTQLAHAYASALGISQEDDTLLILPISPSYTEPQDVLGHLNVSTGLYTPAETGLVEFLKHAEKYQGKMHILIMDEMNLSQVEHWFAPFISLLELEPEDRILRLYSEKSTCHNRSEYPSTIKINDNICFIGTMNMDETTKDFSDRLLDRSNVVIPAKRSFTETKKALKTQQENNYESKEELESAFSSFEQFDQWRSKEDPWDAFEIYELEFFDQLHKFLHDVDPMKGVSFRNIVRLGDYLNHIPIDREGNLLIERQNAIDLFVKQRILTKVRGPIETNEKLIGLQTPDQENPIESKLYEYFTSEKAAEISHFSITIKEIKRKAKELYLNGYAS
ncbi:MAG: McrB family protein [Bacillota bacterium]